MNFENPENISRLEFIELMAKCAAMIQTKRKWRAMFDRFDANNSGHIDMYVTESNCLNNFVSVQIKF